jgi:hypothetical protein
MPGGGRLSSGEVLDAGTLDAWLDLYQGSNRAVNVVLDFPWAGSLVGGLVAPPGRERIVVASTRAGADAVAGRDGLVSFTSYLMGHVFQGRSIGTSVSEARKLLRHTSGRVRQTAQLEDSGNGKPDEKNIDGAVARERYFGPAFTTGDDAPSIGSVAPPVLNTGQTSVALWAADVLDVDGVTNVWVVVTPPEYVGDDLLDEVTLTYNAERRRYEGSYAMVAGRGTYTFTLYAADATGNVSPPAQTQLVGEDLYEQDDSAGLARGIDPGEIETHNLHNAADEDWVKFYAASGHVYMIEASQLGTNVDVAISVYWERPDGTLSNIDVDVDLAGRGEGETEWTLLDLASNDLYEAGVYYICIRSADPAGWGLESEYDLEVYVETGSGALIIVAVDKLNSTQPPPGAKLIVDNTTTQVFTGTSLALSGLGAGVHTVRVVAGAGYYAEEDPALPGQVTNANSVLYGNPKRKQVVDDKWQSVVFQFVGQGRVGTNTVVRDGWTGAWLGGAGLAFRARNGVISNLVYDGYPNAASYETGWQSSGDGRFPGNVWLPTVNYDMTVSLAGYVSTTRVGAVTGLGPGQVVELGEVYLAPVDGNTNGLGDTWEAAYFGVGSNVNAGADADGDGVDNRSEYMAGTDPRGRGERVEGGGGGTEQQRAASALAGGPGTALCGAAGRIDGARRMAGGGRPLGRADGAKHHGVDRTPIIGRNQPILSYWCGESYEAGSASFWRSIRPTLQGSGFNGAVLFRLYQSGNILNLPHAGSNGSHCRGNAQALVNPAKVVVHKVQGNRRFVVLYLLAESVCQASKSAHGHPHGQVLALHEAG